MPPSTDQLIALAGRLGLAEDALDELVHDLCHETASGSVNSGADFDDAHDEAGEQAARINNGGLADQIAFLVASGGADWAAERLHALA